MSTQPPPGRYRVVCYQSGAVNVEDGKQQRTEYGWRAVNPYLCVYGPCWTNKELVRHRRLLMAGHLAEWLNGGSEPYWLQQMDRRSETVMVSRVNGVMIEAVGPFVDVRQPTCLWKQDNRDSACSRRARLMDAVQGIGRRESVT